MKRLVLVVAVIGLAGCGRPDEVPPPSPTATTSPTVAESVGVAPLLLDDPCAVVDGGTLDRLDVPGVGEPTKADGAQYCRWKAGNRGIELVVGVKEQEDPLTAVRNQPAQATEVSGFPALSVALRPNALCEFHVRTAAEQGFWVMYSALDQEIDACGGARTVAEHLAERVREG